MSIPSIFNDVLGPVMRGPSSSHSAAALRIGRLVRDLMDGDIEHVLVEYDPNGSLVTTHKSQGTDMGLVGGLLGWEPTDERLMDYESHIEASGIDIEVRYVSYGATHANTYKLTLSNAQEEHQVIALSTGGGMIEVIEIDGAEVLMAGDYYELLIYVDDQEVMNHGDFPGGASWHAGTQAFAKVRATQSFEPSLFERLLAIPGVRAVKCLHPVLPVPGTDRDMPFTNVAQMLAYNEQQLDLWELGMAYEAARSGYDAERLKRLMLDLIQIWKHAIERGIEGTSYHDRILPAEAPGFDQAKRQGGLLDSPLNNEIILSVSAMMDVKSSMGIIVAAPTAGSCGTLPGTVIGAAKVLKASDDDMVKALFAAGLIGVFITGGATFAAEEAGCMAETGAAGSMAAAALVTMAKGNLDQALGAASFALQNSFGLICDPIGNRVEAPCMGKNVAAASNALSCANMALSNYTQLLPFDEVIESMNQVGKAMPREHCCTGLGGLAATPTARKIEGELENRHVKVSC
ncbi:MAG: L-serine ammonia-lyase, iron-sulfur-dependent, subunit alpha [Bacteroidota bacterium]